MSDDEQKLYDLLVKSIIRIIYPKAELEDTTVILDVNGNDFKATGSIILNQGWYAVDAVPDKKATLPPVEEWESYDGKYELQKGFTEPPKRYTEPDLITAMETAGKNIEDEQARTLMKAENKGLGTPATRAAIINSLFARGYLTKKGKSIMPTEKGDFLIDNLPVKALKSAEMTGEWEKRLHDIAVGKEDFNKFIADMENTVREWYGAIANIQTSSYATSADNLVCPLCSSKVIKGQYGYLCSARQTTGCQFAVNFEICGKRLTDEQIAKLISTGKSPLIKGFKSNSGNDFDAYLVIDKNERRTKFELPEKKELLCPICQSKLKKGMYGYFCPAKLEKKCTFAIGEVGNKKLSDTQVEMLITKGKTGLIKGFKSKSGKDFDAYLVFDKKQNKIIFEFPPKKST